MKRYPTDPNILMTKLEPFAPNLTNSNELNSKYGVGQESSASLMMLDKYAAVKSDANVLDRVGYCYTRSPPSPSCAPAYGTMPIIKTLYTALSQRSIQRAKTSPTQEKLAIATTPRLLIVSCIVWLIVNQISPTSCACARITQGPAQLCANMHQETSPSSYSALNATIPLMLPRLSCFRHVLG